MKLNKKNNSECRFELVGNFDCHKRAIGGQKPSK